MHLQPPMAPIFELGEMQQTKKTTRRLPKSGDSKSGSRYNAYRPSATSSVRVRRRRRSSRNDPHCGHRKDKILASVIAAMVSLYVFLRYVVLPWPRFGIDPVDSSNEGSNYEGLLLETEGERLRREVVSLENVLLRKKSLLGIAPEDPLEDSRGGGADSVPGGGGGGSHGRGWKVVKSSLNNAGTRAERKHPSVRGGQPGKPQVLPDKPHSAAPKGVAGQPMFGLNPARHSLESYPDVIREPVPLVVGGTDGSGTRGVVALLQRLKVPMVVEDGGTMDIHGAPYMAKMGWPAVVGPVMEWAHGAGYDPRNAPKELRMSTFTALEKLKNHMNLSSVKLRASGEGAKRVSWGFKAPVSMLLVPFFAEAWGKAKFLHVVRDGRDIAFSGNQTPVTKFYRDTFPLGSRAHNLEGGPLKAITMWNAWNVGLYDWASRTEDRGQAGLDYLLLHTEDLIDPPAKFAAIKDVAEFVGSPLSDKDLCCIATEGAKDLGSHTKSRKDMGKITSRFGKWKTFVSTNPELSKLLHEEGERGLRLFGYEPERSLRVSEGYQCLEEHDPTCPKFSAAPSRGGKAVPAKRNPRKNTQVPANIQDTATCVGLQAHVDYKGFDLMVGNTEDHLECCEQCRSAHGCTHFTFDYSSGVCYLKTGKGADTSKNGLVSGEVLIP